MLAFLITVSKAGRSIDDLSLEHECECNAAMGALQSSLQMLCTQTDMSEVLSAGEGHKEAKKRVKQQELARVAKVHTFCCELS